MQNYSESPRGRMEGLMSKVWLVTGSAGGLGRNIAEAVLASGDRLVATARDPRRLKDLAEKYGDQIRTVPLDVADEQAAQASVQVAVDAFGRLDVVVNNAGYGDIAPFEQLTSARFKALMDTNFYGVVNLTRAVLPMHRLPCSQVGGWRIHRVLGAGSRPFRRQGVCPRTWRNADELGCSRKQRNTCSARGI